MQGVGGVYRGLGPTVMKQGSNQAIRFFVMESLRNKYTGGDRAVAVPYYLVALFGATAGEVLQIIFIDLTFHSSIDYCSVAGGASVLGNTPIDVIKTRMQSGRFTSSWQCVKHLASNEGVRGFYKGCLPRLNRVCLEVALAFTIFDSVQNLFKNVWP